MHAVQLINSIEIIWFKMCFFAAPAEATAKQAQTATAPAHGMTTAASPGMKTIYLFVGLVVQL